MLNAILSDPLALLCVALLVNIVGIWLLSSLVRFLSRRSKRHA